MSISLYLANHKGLIFCLLLPNVYNTTICLNSNTEMYWAVPKGDNGQGTSATTRYTQTTRYRLLC
jgi:hypothetical protein